MNLNPDTQATTSIIPRSLHLNALNPLGLAAFYRDAVGMAVLEQDVNEQHFVLGTRAGNVEYLEGHRSG